MNGIKYKRILYVIVFVIIGTICIQSYWSYKNYLSSKQYVFNDIQSSLDNALEIYYSEISKENFMTVVNIDESDSSSNFNNIAWDSLLQKIDNQTHKPEHETSNTAINLKSIKIQRDSHLKSDNLNAQIFDSLDYDLQKKSNAFKNKKIKKFTQLSEDEKTGFTLEKGNDKAIANKIFWGKKASDSLKLIKGLSSIFIALQQDTLDYKKLDTLINSELKNKGITSGFYVNHYKNDSLIFSSKTKQQEKFVAQKTAKSTYFKTNEYVILKFKNPVIEIFKRSFLGIALSTLLILTVISCLFYLLKIIKHQKQLAEVKNDLISNITHEFKTPIATISAAIESINNFNTIDDKAKTKKYLSMSSEQLGKLDIMVEKLLETATLDSDSLELNKENFDIIELLQALIIRYQIQFPDKTFKSNFQLENLIVTADVFHIENALNNILDNAVKYGGEMISIKLIAYNNNFDLLISDNGNSLTKANIDRIFEKFYRVPKGNTHDIKGFGIGLYYTKTIIEKHNGSIKLELNKELTTFKITLPNGK